MTYRSPVRYEIRWYAGSLAVSAAFKRIDSLPSAMRDDGFESYRFSCAAVFRSAFISVQHRENELISVKEVKALRRLFLAWEAC